MLTIKATGSIRQVIDDARAVHGGLVPYAAAIGLTRTAQIAQKVDVPDEMRRVFTNPTPYALNSLFVVPATKDNLTARIFVKNQAAASGIAGERFLEPEVDGGSRGEKRFERALRYAGILLPNERAMPGDGIPLDQYGNVSGARVRSILASLKVRVGRGRQGIFAGTVRKTRGIWQRDSSGIKPLFIFTTTAPKYRQRLDFQGVAQRSADAHFPAEFSKALAELRSRNR